MSGPVRFHVPDCVRSVRLCPVVFGIGCVRSCVSDTVRHCPTLITVRHCPTLSDTVRHCPIAILSDRRFRNRHYSTPCENPPAEPPKSQFGIFALSVMSKVWEHLHKLCPQYGTLPRCTDTQYATHRPAHGYGPNTEYGYGISNTQTHSQVHNTEYGPNTRYI